MRISMITIWSVALLAFAAGATAAAHSCDVMNITSFGEALYYVKKGAVSTRDIPGGRTLGCDAPDTLYGRMLCNYYSVPTTALAWSEFDVKRGRLCPKHIPPVMRCDLACPETTFIDCKPVYTPNIVVRAISAGMNTFFTEAATPTAEELADEAMITYTTIVTAVMRYIVLVTACVCQAIVFIKTLPSWLRTLAAVVTVGSYLFAGSFLQATIAFITVFAPLSGAAVNINNAAMAAVTGLAVLGVIITDAFRSPTVSGVVLALFVLFAFGMVSSILSKRITVDTVTYLLLTQACVTIVRGFAMIIVDTANSDPYIATLLYVSRSTMPMMYAFYPFLAGMRITALMYGRAIVAAYPELLPYIYHIVAAAYFGGIGLFMFARAMVGFNVLRNARDYTLVQKLGRGFLLVWTDFQAIPDFIGALFGTRPRRMLSYTALAVTLKGFEAVYAFDFFALSVFVAFMFAIFDWQPFRGGKYLSQLGSIEPGEFRCLDAMPWIDFSALEKLRAFTVRTVLKTTEGTVRGCGFVVRSGAKVTLWTVHHVAAKALVLTSNGREIGVTTLVGEALGNTADAITPCNVALAEALNIDDVPSIPHLSVTEAPKVKCLYLVHTDGMITCVPKFQIDSARGEIIIHVSLCRGDSGTPLFAVMPDGSLRYAGAVSRGDWAAGSGNVASTVAITLDRAGSPGTSDVSGAPSNTYSIRYYEASPEYAKSLVAPIANKALPLSARLTALYVAVAEGFIGEQLATSIQTDINNAATIAFNFVRGGVRFDLGTGGITSRDPARRGRGRGRGGSPAPGRQTGGAEIPPPADQADGNRHAPQAHDDMRTVV